MRFGGSAARSIYHGNVFAVGCHTFGLRELKSTENYRGMGSQDGHRYGRRTLLVVGKGVDTSVWDYETGHGVFGGTQIFIRCRSSTQNVHLTAMAVWQITAVRDGSHGHQVVFALWQFFAAPIGGENAPATASILQPGPATRSVTGLFFPRPALGTWPQHGEIDILSRARMG